MQFDVLPEFKISSLISSSLTIVVYSSFFKLKIAKIETNPIIGITTFSKLERVKSFQREGKRDRNITAKPKALSDIDNSF